MKVDCWVEWWAAMWVDHWAGSMDNLTVDRSVVQ